jgi:XTP/dITP diphosphohydrolase
MTTTTGSKIKVVYVTSSSFKREENSVFVERCSLEDGTPVQGNFEFELRPVPIKEVLETDLQVMVSAEVIKAYSQLKVPCIVEHAGLIFEDYYAASYPGGLTKAMWNTLADRFIEETKSKGRRVFARAVVAYCDGKNIHTFVGETSGTIADAPRGSRQFYWDTIFIPDDPTGKSDNMTYAEILDNPALGLAHKMEHLSQSACAMRKFLAYRQAHSPELWSKV